MAQTRASTAASQPPAAAPRGDAVEVSMLYSSEKQEWVERAAEGFRREHPEVDLKLKAMGSIDVAQAILDGAEQPTVFSPADGLVLNMLASDWKLKHRADLFAASGPEAPQPLVLTPLVFVMWEDRAKALLSSSKGALTWETVRKAVKAPEGWPASGGQPGWGFVKLGHASPARSNSGLQALLLMTFEHHKKTNGLTVADLLSPAYQSFVGDIERGVTRFEPSAAAFMTDMIRFGPSKYDVAVAYESLAIAHLENAQGRWGNLRVYYPATTLWSDHPAAVLQAPWVTPAQRKAASLWLGHLRARKAQEEALTYGFRPADPAVAVRTPQSPFERLSHLGVQVDLPPAAQAPDGQVVRNLLTLWNRQMAR